MADVLETDTGTSPTQRLVILTMALLSDQNGRINASQEEISHVCGTSKQTISASLKALRAGGHIVVESKTTYVVTPDGKAPEPRPTIAKQREKIDLHEDAHEVTQGIFASETRPTVQYVIVLKRVDAALKADWSRDVVYLAGETTKYWTETAWGDALRAADSLHKVQRNEALLKGAVGFYNENRDREQPSFDPETPLDHSVWTKLLDLLVRVGKERFKKAVFRFADDPAVNGKSNNPGSLSLLVSEKASHRWLGVD